MIIGTQKNVDTITVSQDVNRSLTAIEHNTIPETLPNLPDFPDWVIWIFILTGFLQGLASVIQSLADLLRIWHQ